MYGPPSGQSAFQPRQYTPDNLKAWSVIKPSPTLPEREAVRAIHVYDFDNTLFLSPLPNAKIWHSKSLNDLQSPTWLANGGWWHDPRILEATGSGLEEEEKKAWDGWWNENIVQLVQLSMMQKDALTVLLTGRAVKGFSDLTQRILKSKGLVFDMIVLKPEAMPNGVVPQNTIAFKCEFLGELLNTYPEAQEFRVYEDRVKHVRSFEEFCQNYVATTYQRRAHLKTEVIQVAEITCYLDPTTELSKIQMMVGEHNLSQRTTLGRHNPLKVKKTVFYTGYLLNAAGSAALLNELEVPSMVAKESDVKLLANNVLITPRPASKTVLAKTGQFGKCVEFEVVSVGQWENRIWAALVKPVDENVRIYSDNNQPVIVLALKRGTKPIEANRIEASAWKDPPKESIRFFGTVGEKLLLRIEEDINEGEWESLFPKRRSSGNVNHNNNAHNTNATNPHSNSATHAIPSWGNGNSRW